jgi:hypothetical protein
VIGESLTQGERFIMRLARNLGLATVALTVATAMGADELKSGLQVGASVGAFQVVKCGGAPNDGVKEGAQLCYR